MTDVEAEARRRGDLLEQFFHPVASTAEVDPRPLATPIYDQLLNESVVADG